MAKVKRINIQVLTPLSIANCPLITTCLLFQNFPNFAVDFQIHMQFILFDGTARYQLLPFTHTRPVADIRWGILTMRERWEMLLGQKTGTLTEDYLQQAFPFINSTDYIYINASIFANEELTVAIKNLNSGEALMFDNNLIALRTTAVLNHKEELAFASSLKKVPFTANYYPLQRVWDIFSHNDNAIKADFQLLTKGRQSQQLPEYVTALNPSNIFIEPGAKVYPCIINAEAGPVYIGKDAEIMEGCIIRGSFVLGEHAVLKMGAKVYGGTTIGPGCKVGGEISNVVFFANSNKGHDGFLGNAVIGEWCNLGADTNCSNLKNNYDEVKIWDEYENKSLKTGLQFCGLIMGDHSKCGINTMFNTGTVAGVSCNIYGAGFPEKFIPSFSWGGSDGMVTYALDKAINTANKMMIRRNKELSEAEIKILHHIFSQTEKQRELMNVAK
jgi:UDP-N-acetylglucosamine diphosphorylase/glucosamine-1-phosphate N-acetyltransferase